MPGRGENTGLQIETITLKGHKCRRKSKKGLLPTADCQERRHLLGTGS